MRDVGEGVVARCDDGVVEMLGCFMVCEEVLYLDGEFILFLCETNVIGDGIKLNVFPNPERLETLNKILPQILSRQIRRHPLPIEVLIK